MTTNKPPPEIVYHYTSQEGLLNILDSQVLWASHILYLNDQKEFLHAIELTKNNIQNSISLCTNPKKIQILRQCHSKLNHLQICSTFVVSFSEDGNSLSQWRGYGGDGRGFSLGFSKLELEELDSGAPWQLERCIYDPKKQSKKILDMIAKAIGPKYEGPVVHKNTDGVHSVFVMLPDSRLAVRISQLAPLLKHPAFYEEKEWRLTLPENFPTKIYHRQARSLLTPYCHFPLSSDKQKMTCIKEIYIGPGPHPELSEKSLTTLLRSKGLEDVKILHSNIPYRTW